MVSMMWSLHKSCVIPQIPCSVFSTESAVMKHAVCLEAFAGIGVLRRVSVKPLVIEMGREVENARVRERD